MIVRERDPYLATANHFFVREYIRSGLSQWGTVDSHDAGALTLGKIQWYSNHRHDEAADLFRDVTGLSELASAEEKELLVKLSPDGNEEVRMGQLLNSLAEYGRVHLGAIVSQDIDEPRPKQQQMFTHA